MFSSLRARILLLLVLIGLVPLLFAVFINLPLVLDQVGRFYRHAILQNLRADFQDLDEHLASRYETVRLLGKLPEPGAVMGTEGGVEAETVDLERARYTAWVNRILSDQLDVIHISFLDEDGVARYWLERDPESRAWNPTANPPPYPRRDLVKTVLESNRVGVLPTPVRVNPLAKDPAWVLTLQILSPIVLDEAVKPIGLVAVTVDIGGLARRDPNTLWVRDDGSYLQAPGLPQRVGNAFADFPGLDRRFAAGKIALLENGNGAVIWVPLLRTSDDRPLWVARPVDREPLEQFRAALIVRVVGVVLLLVISTFLVARWVATRVERLGQQLLDGIRGMLQRDEAVNFSWRGSTELRQLGEGLSELASMHARNARNLRAHARELEQSNRFKSEFLANVSHELRTPLNSILLLSKLLAEDSQASAEERQQRADVIHEASRDLRALIDDILDLSRIESGRLELNLARVDLRQLLEDVVALLRPQFDERDLYLKLEVDEKAPIEIRTDADKVRQVIKNFLANSVKFTATGGAIVTLEPAAAPHAVRLAVEDSGIGIPSDKHATIFAAFKQADGSTRRRYGGTGLGLTISRELAALLGGEIRLISADRAGATFELLLPDDCARGAESRVAQAAHPESYPPEAVEHPVPQLELGARRVLVLEPDMRRLLALTPVLEEWGLVVAAAGDLEEALETLEEESADLVLISADVSPAEGYVTIRRMRDTLSAKDIAIVALLPAGDEADCDGVLNAGADECLAGPICWHSLSAVVQRRLSSRDAQ